MFVLRVAFVVAPIAQQAEGTDAQQDQRPRFRHDGEHHVVALHGDVAGSRRSCRWYYAQAAGDAIGRR